LILFVNLVSRQHARQWEQGNGKKATIVILKKAKAIICPDNDKSGKEHADYVYHQLLPFCNSIGILNLPDSQPKADISDFIEEMKRNGKSNEQITEIIRNF